MSGPAATERLYYHDAYLTSFDAQVLDRSDDGTRVYLDRTAFYPTSGGQPHDFGNLGGQSLIDVVDEDERIAHVFGGPVKLDGKVSGHVDWTRRFDHMQQHTGQHLLSAVFDDLFGAKTVSVHFGDSSSTVDLETDAMSTRAIEKAERRANLVVAENRPVNVSFEDAASVTGLRKASDRTGILRVITIADLDRSACGGTHVRATGEIGGITIRAVERTKKAIRVEFLCGLRAITRARADFQALSTIAASLSSSVDKASERVTAQSSELKDADQARRRLERDLAKYRAAELHAAAARKSHGARVIVRDEPDSIDNLRVLAQALLEHERAVFVGTTPENHILVAATEDSGFDAGKLLKEAVTAAGGKGGGSPRLAQGSPAPGRLPDAMRVIRAALEPDR